MSLIPKKRGGQVNWIQTTKFVPKFKKKSVSTMLKKRIISLQCSFTTKKLRILSRCIALKSTQKFKTS